MGQKAFEFLYCFDLQGESVGAGCSLSNKPTTVSKLVILLVMALFISASVGITRSVVFSSSESRGSVPFFVTQGCS